MKLSLPRWRPVQPWVAIAWDPHELLAAVAMPTAQGIELLDTLSITLSKEVPLVVACRELAANLRERQWNHYRLLLGVPRSQVEIVSMELPQASPAQLPALVRNEVYRQLSDLPDDMPVDYFLPHTDGHITAAGPTGRICVEGAALRPDTTAQIKAISDALGQQPASIVIRSLAIASVFRRQIRQLPEHAVLLNLMRSNADLSVLERDRITFTRSIHLDPHADGSLDVHHLADEVRMSLFVAPQSPTAEDEEGSGPQHVYMFADVDRKGLFVEQLSDELQLPVTLLDPLAGITLRCDATLDTARRLAPLVGILCDHYDRKAPIDFANPKQPPPPPRTGRKVAAYATATLVALTVGAFVMRRDVAEARQAAAQVSADVDAQKSLLKKIRTKTDVLDAVERWEANQINWLSELRYLSEQFPPADDAVVQRISMAPSGNGRGVVSMSIRVRDPSLIETLEDHLRSERHQVSSQRISQSAGQNDFSCQFETSIVISPIPLGQATVEKAATPNLPARN